jgi:hypothetical protein
MAPFHREEATNSTLTDQRSRNKNPRVTTSWIRRRVKGGGPAGTPRGSTADAKARPIAKPLVDIRSSLNRSLYVRNLAQPQQERNRKLRRANRTAAV